jgi:hypothetical protein
VNESQRPVINQYPRADQSRSAEGGLVDGKPSELTCHMKGGAGAEGRYGPGEGGSVGRHPSKSQQDARGHCSRGHPSDVLDGHPDPT